MRLAHILNLHVMVEGELAYGIVDTRPMVERAIAQLANINEGPYFSLKRVMLRWLSLSLMCILIEFLVIAIAIYSCQQRARSCRWLRKCSKKLFFSR